MRRWRVLPTALHELGSLQATAGEKTSGVLVSWETLSERRLVGFNVVRTRDDSDEVVRVNPIWVPAVGDAATRAVVNGVVAIIVACGVAQVISWVFGI